MFGSHLLWFFKPFCCNYTMKLKEMWFKQLWGFLSICAKFHIILISLLSPKYRLNSFKNGLCATLMRPFFWPYKINSDLPLPLSQSFVLFCFVSLYSLVVFLLLFNEWGENHKNSICKFWVSGPQGAYLCLRFLRRSNKNSPWGGCF